MPVLRKGGAKIRKGNDWTIPPEAAGGPAADVTITSSRVSPIRAASNRFNIGITMTQDTFPSGTVSAARTAVKAALALLDLDFLNMHSHHFGANGPWTNTDKNNGKTYADRATWSGWTAWDARLNHLRDCSPNADIVITLLPPGWCKMDGGAKSTTGSDPLGLGRSWDNLDNSTETRHTDAHRTDMVNIARAIAERHTDVVAFSVINEQKGNFTPLTPSAEKSSDGLSGISNYFEQERYQEALDAAVTQEIWGPYLVTESSGAEILAATYAEFPQPAASASVGSNTFRSYYATKEPVVSSPSNRNSIFLTQWYSRTSSASRSGVYALDWKCLGNDNDADNWEVFFPYRWYWFEMVRLTLQNVKDITGYQSTDRIIGMESYWRKVQDDINVPGDAEQGAMAAEMLRIELEEGVAVHLRWAPEQGSTKPNRNNLFKSTVNADGEALPAYDAYKLFCDHFRGVNVYSAASSNWKIATAVSTATQTLVINHTSSSKVVDVNGTTETVPAYGVVMVNA